MPTLKKCYKHKIDYNPYWEHALSEYLGADLENWAFSNMELWGNDEGDFLYSKGVYLYLAFGKEGFKTLFNYHIINHLIGVCNRYDSLSLKEKIYVYKCNKYRG